MLKHMQKSTTDIYKESSMPTAQKKFRVTAEAGHAGSGPQVKEAQYIFSTVQGPRRLLASHWKLTAGSSLHPRKKAWSGA